MGIIEVSLEYRSLGRAVSIIEWVMSTMGMGDCQLWIP